MTSVIIPTYNRQEKLKKTLKTLEGQTLSKDNFEIIVVDDGSSDETGDLLERFKKNTFLNFNYFTQKNQGAGQARNLGVTKANGSIIFFCGDDTFLDKDLLAIHQAYHQKNKNIAVLGIVLWDDSEKVNDFMHYIAPAGAQFHYNTIRDFNNAGFNHFYTSNISLEKKWFDSEQFDPIFNAAFMAFEDIDLGLRLEKRGLRIIFEPRAKVFHSHYYQPESFHKRMFRVGRNIIIFLDKFKQDKRSYYLLKWKYMPFSFFIKGTRIFHLFSHLLSKSNLLKKINIKYHWFWSFCYYYSKGILEELSKQKDSH